MKKNILFIEVNGIKRYWNSVGFSEYIKNAKAFLNKHEAIALALSLEKEYNKDVYLDTI